MMDHKAAAITLTKLINDYIKISENSTWRRFDDVEWEQLAETNLANILTETQIGAVRTAMLVEDHIPDYGREYLRIFPVSDAVNDEIAWENRQLTHFIYRWTAEEDRHGHTLETYLRVGNLVDEDELTDEMVLEGKKNYQAPHDNRLQLFTYTVMQEKATQLFYASLRSAVNEPILQKILNFLAKDESRHGAFFADMVLHKLDVMGPAAAIDLKVAVEAFSMPLQNMLQNYRRQAVRMARAAPAYKVTAGYDYFERVLNKYLQAKTASTEHAFADVLAALRALQPDKALPTSA